LTSYDGVICRVRW